MSFQLIPQAYAATKWTGECIGIVATQGSGGNIEVATIQGVTCLIKNILAPMPAFIALVAVGIIIMAGIRLTTAGSDPKAVASAWNMFTWAIIGLVLLAGVWLALIIIENITGAKVTQFGV